MSITVRKYVYNHKSPETAKVVDDYPWGFRLRTTIRYWVETKIAKNGGQRFASQTINPKTGCWCAPKYSTYSPLIVMYLDENEHVNWENLGYGCSADTINDFTAAHRCNLDDYQREKLKEIIATECLTRHITFMCVPLSQVDESDRRAAHELELKNICQSISDEVDRFQL